MSKTLSDGHAPSSFYHSAWPVSLMLLCAAILYTGSLSPSTGHSIDDGIHLVAAKSMATGQGLRMISDPDAPLATQFPPGHSLFLVPVLWLFPDPPTNAIPLQLVSTVFALCFVYLSWLWLRRHFEPSAALLMTALIAFNPETVRFAGAVIAEMGYAAFTMATFLFFDRALPNGQSNVHRNTLLGAVVMMTGAYLFRSVGIGLVMAVVATLALRRRWYAAAWAIAGFLILASPWLFKSVLVGTPEYRGQFWLADLENPEMGRIGPEGLIARMVSNAVSYLSETIPNHLFPLLGSQRVVEGFQGAEMYPVLVVGRLCLSGLLVVGFWRRIRSGLRMPELYMFAYFAMLLLWHNRIQWKYMAPVTPLLLYYLYTGISYTFSRISLRLPRIGLSYAFLSLMLVACLLRAPDSLAKGWWTNGTNDPYALAYGWIKNETPPNSLVVGFDHLGLFLYTGRKTIAPLMSHDPQQVMNYLSTTGAQYFVIEPRRVSNERRGLEELYQRPVLEKFPERFSQVFFDPASHIEIYRIDLMP